MPEELEHKPLANLLRGLEAGAPSTAAELTQTLRGQGLDADEVITRVEAKISAYLQSRRPASAVAEKRRSRGVVRIAKWRHPSVQRFAEGGDPVEKMISIAGDFVLSALENPSSQSVVDPFVLADKRRIPVVPCSDISDARTIPLSNGRLQIQFNPNQPKSRLRFSIAHELAHTLLPDCHERVRNRAPRSEFEEHEWELEMLCNIGAAELLMPIASFPDLTEEALSIDNLMELRKSYQVSSEAMLLRVVKLTSAACAVFAASLSKPESKDRRYKIDYLVASRAWDIHVLSGEWLPKDSVVGDCTAIGFTAHRDEVWKDIGSVHVEAAGIPPYPGARYPRAIGIVRPLNAPARSAPKLLFVKGDATQPRGVGPKIIAHVVNDKGRTWGTGFARAVAEKWPGAEEAFTAWITASPGLFRLGNTYKTDVAEDVSIFQMICQHGYGASPHPRFRYGALKSCLDELAIFALERKATVHMPRIGSGQGGGVWSFIQQMIDESLCRRGISVVIYDLPNARPARSPELPNLFGK